jgi:hypothetical protein
MALGLTQPLTEISIRNISWGGGGKGGRCVGLTTLQSYHLPVPIVLKYGNLNPLEPQGPVHACNRIPLPLPFFTCGSASWRPSVYPNASPFLFILVTFNRFALTRLTVDVDLPPNLRTGHFIVAPCSLIFIQFIHQQVRIY